MMADEATAAFSEQVIKVRDWQAGNVVVVAVYAADEDAAQALNAVGARFVQWFSALNVSLNLGVAEVAKVNAGLGKPRPEVLSCRIKDGHTSRDTMMPATKRSQHQASIFFVSRLAEDAALNLNQGVGCDDKCVSVPPSHLSCFLDGEVADLGLDAGIDCDDLSHVAGIDLEIQTETEQEIAPSRGGGGEDEAAVSVRTVHLATGHCQQM